MTMPTEGQTIALEPIMGKEMCSRRNVPEFKATSLIMYMSTHVAVHALYKQHVDSFSHNKYRFCALLFSKIVAYTTILSYANLRIYHSTVNTAISRNTASLRQINSFMNGCIPIARTR